MAWNRGAGIGGVAENNGLPSVVRHEIVVWSVSGSVVATQTASRSKMIPRP